MPGNQIVKPDYETPLIQSRRASRLAEGVVTEMTNLSFFFLRNYASYVTTIFLLPLANTASRDNCIKGSVANHVYSNLFPFLWSSYDLVMFKFRASDFSILTKFPPYKFNRFIRYDIALSFLQKSSCSKELNFLVVKAMLAATFSV